MSSHCHRVQGAQGSHAHPSRCLRSHLCWQLELSATSRAANSIYSPSWLYMHPLVVITLVKPRSMRQKKERVKCRIQKTQIWLPWLRNTLIVLLLLKAQTEIPHAQSHLHNSNVWKTSSSSFISLPNHPTFIFFFVIFLAWYGPGI